jgi:hypothetical protein
MGDGVLIYFGYPRAHEDDARRVRLRQADCEQVAAEFAGTGASEPDGPDRP